MANKGKIAGWVIELEEGGDRIFPHPDDYSGLPYPTKEKAEEDLKTHKKICGEDFKNAKVKKIFF